VEQTTQTSVKQANDALAQKLAKEDEINQQLQSDLKVVTDKLNVTQSDLVKAVSRIGSPRSPWTRKSLGWRVPSIRS